MVKMLTIRVIWNYTESYLKECQEEIKQINHIIFLQEKKCS